MAKNETPLEEKQYYVLINYKEEVWKKGWKKGTVISLPVIDAQAYIGAKVISPLRTALENGQYVPKIEIATYVKPKPEPRSSQTAVLETEKKTKKKTLVKNTLRDAVQEKKQAKDEPLLEEESPQEKIEEKPESTKETSSSSAAEDAIKAKIAAAKKDKKK